MPTCVLGQKPRFDAPPTASGLPQILLQKSKLATVRIFGETLKREAVDDSYNLSHVTEVAYESARGDEVPHISTRKPSLRPSEFLMPSAKRLLQQNPLRSRHRQPAPACPFGANKRLMHRSKQQPYSITSSAWASSVGGTVRQ
jgi:hypothetical protein